ARRARRPRPPRAARGAGARGRRSARGPRRGALRGGADRLTRWRSGRLRRLGELDHALERLPREAPDLVPARRIEALAEAGALVDGVAREHAVELGGRALPQQI